MRAVQWLTGRTRHPVRPAKALSRGGCGSAVASVVLAGLPVVRAVLLILHVPVLFASVGHVVANGATTGRAQHAMSSHVTGKAADRRALQASSGLRGRRSERDRA
jgi:hypothetical protein